MTERQRKFREQYVAQISRWYNGWVHIGVMYTAGIAGIWYCVSQLQNATWEWLLLIPVLIAGNFGEWAMHKYIMHRLIDVYALRAIFDRHTRQHHQYFTDNEHTIDTVREFRIVFFPWRVLIVLAVFGVLFGWIASVLINPNAGYIVFIGMIAHYMVYETFHFCCHVRENWFVRSMPLVNTIRRHHAAHHNMGIMMHVNMNLTFPVADWFLNTSDLRRGLFGHLFNGYSDKHVKPELKPVMARFRTSETQDKRVTLEGPQLSDDELRTLASAGGHVSV
ncbi:MAG: fatty acid hydroxylase family protein [Burkholderiaceae bacterium]